jgi:hypothetical protein
VRNLSTGQDREIHRSDAQGGCVWGLQRSKLFCGELPSGDLLAGRLNLYSISPESGAIEQLHSPPAPVNSGLIQPSTDGQAAYLAKPDRDSGTITFLRWEFATGQETVIERSLPLNAFIRLSPDERWLIRAAALKVEARPTSGGDWRPLASLNKAIMASNAPSGLAITPDSKWVVYHDVDSAGKHGLFRVPISGGTPERLGDYACSAPLGESIEISPDGRKILVTARVAAQDSDAELWLLENFVPRPAKH